MTLTQTLIMFVYPATVGMILGLCFYGGLWLILRKLQQLQHPAIWISLSLLLRTLGVVFVLYLLFNDSWQQLLIAVSGMLITRTLLVKRIKPGTHHADKQIGQVP